jgi:hypothetical protein
VKAVQHHGEPTIFRRLQGLVFGHHPPKTGDVAGKRACKRGVRRCDLFGRGATLEGLVLCRQDITTQGIVHHVRLEVVAQRMLHDRAFVEPRDQLGQVPEPGAPDIAGYLPMASSRWRPSNI